MAQAVAVIYVRAAKQETADMWLDTCRLWCDENKVAIVAEFADLKVSPNRPQRPVLENALKMLQMGKADHLVCFDLHDLWGQGSLEHGKENARYWIRRVKTLQATLGFSIVYANDGGTYDPVAAIWDVMPDLFPLTPTTP